MPTERLIKISPDGRDIEFVYSDKVPWKDLGKMESCDRASDVIFNKETQMWDIKFIPSGITAEGFCSRECAIRYEIELLEKAMGSG